MKKSNHQVAIERLENIRSALMCWEKALHYMIGNMKKSIDEYKKVVQDVDFENIPEEDQR